MARGAKRSVLVVYDGREPRARSGQRPGFAPASHARHWKRRVAARCIAGDEIQGHHAEARSLL